MLLKTSRRQIKIFELLNTLKPSRQNDECCWSVCKKKKLRIFCFQKHCNWQSSSKCPDLTINTVMKEGAKGKIARKEKAKRLFFIFIYISFPLLALWSSPSYPLAILCSAWGMDANVKFFLSII